MQIRYVHTYFSAAFLYISAAALQRIALLRFPDPPFSSTIMETVLF